jgi:hypothetical protein
MVYSTFEFFKIGQITTQTVFKRWLRYSTSGLATVPRFVFSFKFILAESLKNHSKSQKIIK